MKTYIQQCKDKTIEFNEDSFNDFVDFWHTSEKTRNITLHDAIGISLEEYGKTFTKENELFQLIERKINEQ